MHNIIDLVLNTKYLTAQDEPITCILHSTNGVGALYLGNLDAANDSDLLKKHKIKAVLSAVSHETIILPSDITHLKIYATDTEDFPLNKYFNQTNQFIEQHRNTTNVFVHCQAGISRSASLVIAYLIKTFQWSYQYAFKQVKMARKCIFPNSGFISQLQNFERQLFPSYEEEDNYISYKTQEDQNEPLKVNNGHQKKKLSFLNFEDKVEEKVVQIKENKFSFLRSGKRQDLDKTYLK